MSEQILRDRVGNAIGKISTQGNGVLVIRDKLGNTLGTYDPRTNQTYDKLGNTIGSGNLLTTLLRD